MIDDVVAFDRGDGDGRPGLGHGDGLAGGGLVAVGVGDQCSDGGGAVGQSGRIGRGNGRRPSRAGAVHRRDVGLDDAAVGDGDVEARAARQSETVPVSATPASASV